jgi:hypothetical protein
MISGGFANDTQDSCSPNCTYLMIWLVNASSPGFIDPFCLSLVLLFPLNLPLAVSQSAAVTATQEGARLTTAWH